MELTPGQRKSLDLEGLQQAVDSGRQHLGPEAGAEDDGPRGLDYATALGGTPSTEDSERRAGQQQPLSETVGPDGTPTVGRVVLATQHDGSLPRAEVVVAPRTPVTRPPGSPATSSRGGSGSPDSLPRLHVPSESLPAKQSRGGVAVAPIKVPEVTSEAGDPKLWAPHVDKLTDTANQMLDEGVVNPLAESAQVDFPPIRQLADSLLPQVFRQEVARALAHYTAYPDHIGTGKIRKIFDLAPQLDREAGHRHDQFSGLGSELQRRALDRLYEATTRDKFIENIMNVGQLEIGVDCYRQTPDDQRLMVRESGFRKLEALAGAKNRFNTIDVGPNKSSSEAFDPQALNAFMFITGEEDTTTEGGFMLALMWRGIEHIDDHPEGQQFHNVWEVEGRHLRSHAMLRIHKNFQNTPEAYLGKAANYNYISPLELTGDYGPALIVALLTRMTGRFGEEQRAVEQDAVEAAERAQIARGALSRLKGIRDRVTQAYVDGNLT